jgi:hypothetical protein
MFGSFGFLAANARTEKDTDPRRNLTVFYSIKPNNRTSSRKSLYDGGRRVFGFPAAGRTKANKPNIGRAVGQGTRRLAGALQPVR